MRTDELIRAMAADTRPERPVAALLPWALLAAGLGVAALGLPLLGVRPDLGAALTRAPVLLKQVFPWLLAAGGLGVALRLARPGATAGPGAVLVAAVPLLLATAFVATMRTLPPADWQPAMMGNTARQCLAAIALMSVPLLAAALGVLRRGASTRPALAGAAAGLLSGSIATGIYAMHCTEDSPLFYAVWYGLAILLVTAAGALLGRRLLRW